TTVLNDQPGIKDGLAGMGTDSFRDVAAEMGILTPEIAAAGGADFVIAARAESAAAFERALRAVEGQAFARDNGGASQRSYATSEAAAKAHPEANMCSIAVPGEYALAEVKRALN